MTDTVTPIKKTRRKPERSFHFHGTVGRWKAWLVEVLEVGPRSRHSSYYLVLEQPADFGRCFRWEKVQMPGSKKSEGPYHVNLGDASRNYPASCDCKGFEHHHRQSGIVCRHLAGSRELIAHMAKGGETTCPTSSR